MKCRWWCALAFAVGLTGPLWGPLWNPLWGQQPEVPRAFEDEDEAEDEEPEGGRRYEPPLPEVPETVVPGRPGLFPAEPLTEDAVLTPTRGAAPSDSVGSAVSVITREDIANTGQRTVTEVLRTVLGVDVVQQGNRGGLTSVFMRGANSQHTKVLLDGIPMNDPSNATRGFDFSTLMVDNIERIEVLRGPQSVLYGSDAIGGVINVVTRRGEGPPEIRASVMGGAFGTLQESVQVSGGDDCKYYSLSGSYFDTTGFSAANRNRGNIENDGYTNGTVSGRFGWTPSDLVNVDYVFRYSDAHAEVDNFDFASGLPFDDPGFDRTNITRAFYNRVQLQSLLLDGAVDSRVGFNLTDYDRRDTNPGFFAPPLFLGQTREVDYQADILLSETNVLTAGAAYLHEEASTTFNPQASQHNRAVFLQDQFQVGSRWFGTVGVRWDDHSVAGPANTYRTTSEIRVHETGTVFHGTLGTGFRAPALAESLFAFGNPNLRPERSKGWDVGATQQLASGILVVDATYFRNDFEDLIVFDFTIPPFGALANVGQARATGVELAASLELSPRSRITANYTHTDTVNLQTGQPLLRRPRDKVAVMFDRRFACDRAFLRLTMLYFGDRLDTLDSVLDEYFRVDLAGTYDLSRSWQLFGRIDNLLDEQYEEVRGFGTPGISAYGGVNFYY